MNQHATAQLSHRPPARSEEKPKLHFLPLSTRPDVEFGPGAPTPLGESEQASSPHLAFEPAVWTDPEPPSDIFLALQRWEGVVIECREETFLARLTDLTAEGTGEEEVELLLDDVPDEDRSLIGPGAVFYWAIGYRYEASGQSSRVSTLRFRRLPVWSASELEAAHERARQVAEVFATD